MTENDPNEANTAPWSFRSGDLALDFANTVDWHDSEAPDELLNDYIDLLSWSVDFEVLDEPVRRRLDRWAEANPGKAEAALEQARTLREAVYRIFKAAADEREPTQVDLDILADAYAQAVDLGQLVVNQSGAAWSWEGPAGSIDFTRGTLRSSRLRSDEASHQALGAGYPQQLPMLWPVAAAAVTLLLSKEIERVGQCRDDRGCGALFLDASRNRSREWCRMETCGNRAKARRHYERTRAG